MTIVAAAIRAQTGEVFPATPPYSYDAILREGGEDGTGAQGHPELLGGTYGFVNEKGAFLDRCAALLHVQRTGQTLLRTPNKLVLHPSDLW